jgi:TonB family protein
MDAVGNILADRREDHVPWGPASLLAFLLHAAVLVGVLLSTFARPQHFAAPRAVAVRLLPAGSLHVRESARSEPAPPPSTSRPKIEKPVEAPPPPSEKALLLPSKERKKKPTSPPVSRPGRAPTPAVSLPSAGPESAGAASTEAGGAGGAAGVGSLKLDQADFDYPVYIERIVTIISLNWFKPAQQVAVSVVHFQIERDGTITNPEIVTSSGLPFVDRAALRAVIASSPLPPLPTEYAGPHLGIQVTFE